MTVTTITPNTQPRYHAWQRGPYYFEIRDTVTGDYVDIKVGAGAREAADAECARLNAAAIRIGGEERHTIN